MKFGGDVNRRCGHWRVLLGDELGCSRNVPEMVVLWMDVGG